MENREFDRQEYNMGGRSDGPYRGDGPRPQGGNRNGSRKNRFWAGALVGAFVTAFVGLIVMGMSTGIYIFGKRVMSCQLSVAIEGRGLGTTDGSSHEDGVDFDRATVKMFMIQQIIDLRFLYDEGAGNMEDFIYRRVLADLDDPYSTYYTEEDFHFINDGTKGTYFDIEAMLSQNGTTELCTIVKVFKGSPALEVGMQPGDIIYEMGGTPVTFESLDVLVNNCVRGEGDANVTITVYRVDKGEYAGMSITRRKIEVPAVRCSMLNDKVGRIVVSEFDVITVEQFGRAADELQKDGMEGLIIDLRSNPGGVLDSVVKVVGYVPPDDLDQYERGKGRTLIVYAADKNEKGDVFTASDGHELKTLIVILVNGGSAGASEVFIGTLRDYNWVTAVGTTSYGRGIVQSLISLGGGSATEIATAHYYTLSGFDLHGKGIEPDMEAELNKEPKTQAVVKSEEDNQLQKIVQVLKENK